MFKLNRLLLLLLTLAAALYGQPPSGTLHGVITDESGAVVPGARVTISNAAGPVKSAASRNDGSYSITGLTPGNYFVQASSPGLAQNEPANADFSGGLQSVELNLQLRVSLEKQEVTVQENPGPSVSVDPAQNAGALVLRGADLDSLSDDPDDLQADLQALAGPSAGPNGGQIYIDGFTGGTLPAKDSIREIRINQNPFSPEFDKLGYGRIEILTKPGTDKFRGNVNANFGDDIFNSRNPYAQQKAPFLEREFGGTVSGPLSKKASFFLDVFDRDIHNGNIINAVTADPNTFAITPFNTVFEAPQNRLRISPRVDYQLSQNNTLMFRYGFTRNDIQDQGIGNLSLLSRGYHSLNTDHTVQATETAVLSNKVINETRFQLYHQENDQTANTLAPGLIVSGSFAGGGAQVGHSTNTDNRYELQNYTSIASGAHAWKFGVRVRAVTVDNFSPNNFGGSFTFAGGYAPILDPVTNLPVAAGVVCSPLSPNPGCQNITSIQRYQRTLLFQQMHLDPLIIQQYGGGATQFNINAGNPLAGVTQADIGAFVGDDWRVKPNLTLSLGLRYETQTNIHDWHDWAPRIGFAWAPGQSKNNPRPKTVIRGGFGMFYDRFSETNTLTAERFNGITEQQYTVLNPTFFPTIPSIDQISRLGTSTTHSIQQIDSNLRAPYILQEAFTVERQLPYNSTVSVSYMNSHGVHEFRSQDINAPLPGTYTGLGTGVFPYANAGPLLLMESAGLYNQWQLVTNARSQINSKISLNGFYMYGHAYSNSDGLGTIPANPYSMAGEYGPSSLDVRHRGLIAGSIATKWDLRLSPFITMNSGAPFNILAGTDPYGTTLLSSARPGIATDPNAPGVIQTRYGLLDPNPKPGEQLLPRNFARSPGNFSVNLRLAKTFGFGASRERPAGRGGGGDFGGRGPGGGGGPRGPGGRGPGGFGGFGPPGGFGGGGASTNRRYNLTLSVQARNLLNHVNPGPINGIVTSPLFGTSNTLAGGFGAFAENGNNRRFEMQMRFTF
ncbi:MAG TPA: carboxypeptidase-like regulatory domain-containing protein [Bryobacteraceae bacterium]|nr:carboxypeptidase-like regulatory domain-containing protein [Bryobacteraceae bacterium]